MIKVGILGASGYAGGELLRLCAAHSAFTPILLFGDSQAGEAVAAAHPHLALAYPGVRFERYAPERLAEIDLLFACMPHGESQKIAPDILARGVPFVDLGADFRLDDAATFARWYGEAHEQPDLLAEFVYGLPEIARDRIRGAKLVAAPGCYPTSAILALKPLVDAGLIEKTGIIVDAASGVTGAGRAAKAGTHFCTVDESLAAYGLIDHRHTAEMEMGTGGEVLFTPHLAPMNRGILATCYANAARDMDAGAPLDTLKAAYEGEPFVHVSGALPATKWTLGSNAVHLTARYDPRTRRVVAIAALDNLVKGAAGQMIQCANLMLGLDETEGLARIGVYP
ncbi:N-acetyl-gamma-glutamyl-phosphate reductase [Allosphingosinicella flava]|uniref:N-acetyl-gamma-glutamyl-phosphate reductase n=1 Tax=Allosphingosinicella flava TaxID=2771430 RepID=A0A7T2LLV0_9SPHN|nr:N-acetyl-gamma-glutamyl-phosphate reductase [Sphingosinicella flava]QPQ54896.1 N-acetyl-gamma-glutamyl-phosphate reductase [Sphingosinicella flava]